MILETATTVEIIRFVVTLIGFFMVVRSFVEAYGDQRQLLHSYNGRVAVVTTGAVYSSAMIVMAQTILLAISFNGLLLPASIASTNNVDVVVGSNLSMAGGTAVSFLLTTFDFIQRNTRKIVMAMSVESASEMDRRHNNEIEVRKEHDSGSYS